MTRCKPTFVLLAVMNAASICLVLFLYTKMDLGQPTERSSFTQEKIPAVVDVVPAANTSAPAAHTANATEPTAALSPTPTPAVEPTSSFTEWRLQMALRELERLDWAKGLREERFGEIYDYYGWGRSGDDSSVAGAWQATTALNRVITKLGIRTLFDAGFGSFTWMSQIDLPASNVTYVGVDIGQDIVDDARELFGRRPDLRQFYRVDLVDGAETAMFLRYPDSSHYRTRNHDWREGWDLVLCRNVLNYLPLDAARRVLFTLNDTNSRYLLITDNPNSHNIDADYGVFHEVNLRRPPFSLPKPMAYFKDGSDYLVLYRLPLKKPLVPTAFRPQHAIAWNKSATTKSPAPPPPAPPVSDGQDPTF